MNRQKLDELAEAVGGEIKEVGILPDNSGFAVMSMPLPEDHWIYGEPECNVPPMPLLCGTDDSHRPLLKEGIVAAARYAVRSSTMNGEEMDFDPDALVQNMVVGMLGYFTPNGLSEDEWANPEHLRQKGGKS